MLNLKLFKLVSTVVLGLLFLISILFVGSEQIVLGDDQTNGDTITPTQTISGTWSGALTATSDITITSGVVITITPGTTIQVATNDSAGAGDDPARIEFIVQNGGELRVNGPVTFTSKAASPAPADWYGIRFEAGSKGWIDGAVIEYGVHGLILSTTNAITVVNSALRYNRHAPLSGKAWGAGLAIFTGDHLISNTLIYSNSLSSTVALTKAMGGGVFLAAGNTLFEDCAVYSNTVYSAGSSFGGGLALRGGAPTIQHCQIYNNHARAGAHVYGGGMDIYDSNAVIRANTSVYNNIAAVYYSDVISNIVVAVGGGISISSDTIQPVVHITGSRILTNTMHISRVTSGSYLFGQGVGIGFYQKSSRQVMAYIKDNLIAWNTGRIEGAGMWVNGGGIGGNATGIVSGSISRNIIRNNTITGTYRGFGGGIHLSDDQVAVRDNLFFANRIIATGQARGGGMYIHNGGDYNSNNTVVSNTVRGATGADGGGIKIVGCAISNTIVVSNAAYAPTANGGGAYWTAADGSGYNDIWGNYPTDNYTNNTTSLINNISVDPLFIGHGSVTMTYHLQQGSPVIDAGTGTNAPSSDFDRQSRPLSNGWDIGFDEVTPFTYTKSVNLDIAQENDTLTYTIIISNPDIYAPVVGGVITDVLPFSTTHSTNPACNLGACAWDSGSNTITWTGNISAGNILTLTYGVLVNSGVTSGTEITNTAFVTVGAVGGWTNRVTTTVTSTIISKPVFTLTKKATSTVVGAPVTYTLTITNSSVDAAASNVVVSDTLPAGTTYVPNSGGTLFGSDVVTWSIANILPLDSAQVSFAITTCQTSITNTNYQVVTSTQGVSSDLGAPLTTNLADPTLSANFNYAPTSGITIGQTIIFTGAGTTNGSSVAAWGWDFGNTHSASGASVSHAYDAPGLYTVTLLITDTCGYTATRAVGIEVLAELTVNIVGNGSVSKQPDQTLYHYGDVVTLTATASPGWSFGSWSGGASGVLTETTVTMNSNKAVTATFVAEPPPCTGVTGVDLSLQTQGTLTPTTTVQFSADIAPDNAANPYTYTIDYGGGRSTPTSGSDDPLSLDHTFGATGTYTVEIAVWNCSMAQTASVTDSVQVIISEGDGGSGNFHIYLPLVMK